MSLPAVSKHLKVLERAGLPVGCVTSINGATRLSLQVQGVAGHAGTVPMAGRRDALAAVELFDPVLGWVPGGFIIGVNDAIAEMAVVVDPKNVALIGHSLGAAHASEMGARLAAAGTPALQVLCYGCPRPGGAQMSGILTKSSSRLEYFRNENDPVTHVPPPIPTVSQHVLEPTQIHGGADPSDKTMFREHHIGRYQLGLAAVVTGS